MRLLFIPIIIFVCLVLGSFSYPACHLPDKILTGKKLYENNCRSCHKLFEPFVGEPLCGTLERIPNKLWLYKYIDSSVWMVNTDPYAKCLNKKYNGVLMTIKNIFSLVNDVTKQHHHIEQKKAPLLAGPLNIKPKPNYYFAKL